ncbi:MAG: hypothetical protein ACE361_01715 [Aureliella sp.]
MGSELTINSKQDLVTHIFRLLDVNDAIERENEAAYSFPQSLAAWLNDCDGYYQDDSAKLNSNIATWQLFGDALTAASNYE